MIEKVAKKIAYEQNLIITEVYVIKTLETLAEHTKIGKKRLSEILGIGEGRIRTIVKHLKAEGLIKTSLSGMSITELAAKILFNLKSKIGGGMEIPKSPLTVGPFNVAVIVRNAGHAVKYGIEQRDSALKIGALGATTLVFINSKLIMPGVSEDIFKGIEFVRDMPDWGT